MLATAQEEAEFSASMALEREVLVLCRDRWGVLKEMMDAELALSEVLRRDGVDRERRAIELEELRSMAQARIEGARRGAEEAAKEAAARELRKQERTGEQAAAAVAVKEPEPEPEERFGWLTIIGSGTDLRARVTDGGRTWWVGIGDELPGGARIASIRARPPRVVVRGGAASGLPYRGSGG